MRIMWWLTRSRFAAAATGTGLPVASAAALAHGTNRMGWMVAVLLLSSVIVALAQQTLP
jgi:hypothetical protein